jgi:hypothetical protein
VNQLRVLGADQHRRSVPRQIRRFHPRAVHSGQFFTRSQADLEFGDAVVAFHFRADESLAFPEANHRVHATHVQHARQRQKCRLENVRLALPVAAHDARHTTPERQASRLEVAVMQRLQRTQDHERPV